MSNASIVINEALGGKVIDLADIPKSPLFEVGSVLVDPEAARALLDRYPSDEAAGEALIAFLVRHMGGDWEHMEPLFRDDNRVACEVGTPVMSQFPLPLLDGETVGEEIILLTSFDRTFTDVTVLSAMGED